MRGSREPPFSRNLRRLLEIAVLTGGPEESRSHMIEWPTVLRSVMNSEKVSERLCGRFRL
jgi:hypothetical protein